MSARGATTEAVPEDPFAALSTRRLETELLSLAGHIAAAQCRFLQLLAAYDRRGGWAGPGLRSCAHWLSWRIGMNLRTATEHVRVAHALTALPLITEAFAAGRISYSKVRAITRVTPGGTTDDDGSCTTGQIDPGDGGAPGAPHQAGAPETPTAAATHPAAVPAAAHLAGPAAAGSAAVDPAAADPANRDQRRARAADPATSPAPADTEKTLLDLALAGTASHVETVVRALRRRQTQPTATAAQRNLSWHWAEDGSLVLRARLTSTDGAALIAAVDALVPAREPVTHPVPPPPEDWPDRGAEHAPGAVTDRLGARRADALLALATGTADTARTDRDGAEEGEDGESGGQVSAAPVVARGPARIVVLIDTATATARIQGGPEIPAATAERLACDAEAQILLSDRTRNRLYLGRNRRLASPAQIAALTLRDGGRCQFPGCTHARHLHAHHITPWMRGGRTDLDNLILLCSFHHTLIHDRGYRIRRLPDRWQVRRPDGTPIDTTGPPLTGNIERLIENATHAGLRINPHSLTPTWGGERLDPTPILDALLPRTPRAA